MNKREQAISTIVPDKLITITCTIIDGKEHFTAQINRTGELFKCPPEVARELVPIMVAMEQEIRNELSALSEPGGEAEPVAWMTEDGRLATTSAKSAMPSSADASFIVPLYVHPAHAPVEGKETPTAYAMSRDYEALLAHLLAGGEAFGLKDMPGKRHPVMLSKASLVMPDYYPIQLFEITCKQINLEWLAPLSVDRIMEVVEPFMRDDSKYWKEEDRKNLRSRLSSELGLK